MAQYTKFPNQISAQDGWHINYPMDKSASEMKKICDEQLGCQGYQTGGGGNTIFYGLYQAGNWTRVNDGRSLYVKKPPDLPKYKFLQNRDTQGNDITHIGGKRPIKEVAAACDADPDCKAFNTYGFLKRKSTPTYFWGNSAEKSMGLYVKDSKKYCESTGKFDDPICVNLCSRDPSWCRLTKRSICQKKGRFVIDDPMCKTLCSKKENKDICDPIYQVYCELPENIDKLLCACFKNDLPVPGTFCLDPKCRGSQAYKTQDYLEKDCPSCAQYINTKGDGTYVQGKQTMTCNTVGTHLVPKTTSRSDPAELPKFTGNDITPDPNIKTLSGTSAKSSKSNGTNWVLIGGLSAGGLLFIIILITLIWQLTK